MPIIRVTLEDVKRLLREHGVSEEKMPLYVDMLKQLDRDAQAKIVDERSASNSN